MQNVLMRLNEFFLELRDKTPIIKRKKKPCAGRIDKIDADGFICGWAFDGGREPLEVSAVYKGRQIGVFPANIYRHDLELAGIGAGRHAFRIPIPDQPHAFEPDDFIVSLPGGGLLEHSDQLRRWAQVDLLFSPSTPHVHIELTSRCNLRCVYCAVSQPFYQGKDLALELIDDLVMQMKSRGTTSVAVNGHGETTYISDWFKTTDRLLEGGFGLSLTSNLARRLGPEELEAMSRMSYITVSLDTHDAVLLKRLRRKVELENILVNMENIRTASQASLRPEPKFSWSCVLSDVVAPNVLDYVKFGMAVGVKDFIFCNLVSYPTPPDAISVRNIAAMAPDALRSVKAQLDESRRLLEAEGGTIFIAGDLEELVLQGADLERMN
jgi:hypothetical protein